MTDQSLTLPSEAQPTSSPLLRVSWEVLIYIIMFTIAGMMYLLRLGDVPLTTGELSDALAAWGIVFPNVSLVTIPNHTLKHVGQIVSFSLFGGTEMAARLPIALWALMLTAAPLLFRPLLGRTRTLITAMLLAVSPVMLASARLGSGTVITMTVAMGLLWAIWRSKVTDTGWARVIVLAIALVALTGPDGLPVFLTLIMAFLLAHRLYADETDSPTVADGVRHLPWLTGLSLSALLVLLIATGFMAYPRGLNTISAGIADGLRGWVLGSGVLHPRAMVSSLVYEGGWWVVALMSARVVMRQERKSFADLFLVAWLIIATIVALIYAGATPASGLWLTLPLMALSAHGITQILSNGVRASQGDTLNDLSLTIPTWAYGVIALGTSLLLLLVMMHFGMFARALADSDAGLGQTVPSLLILVVLVLLFFFVAFTIATVYGPSVTFNGVTTSIVVVLVAASLGSGWQVTWSRVDRPTEYWHHASAPSMSSALLRDTLIELTKRESGGFNYMPVTVVRGDYTDGERQRLAWTLRDFYTVQWVTDIRTARGQSVVIAPVLAEDPDLGGGYVGQTFVLSRHWPPSQLNALNLPVWLYQRQVNADAIPQRVVLWLRQDVYNGVNLPAIP